MGIKIENKKAYHDYFIEETFECGISLRGNEVKSIRKGKASIKESWVTIENGELIIRHMHITAWDTANKFDVNETRDRKLLAHKKEIKEMEGSIAKQGYTLVPLKIYFNDSAKCKVLIGLAKGKHLYDKRRVERDRQIKRDISRALKGA